MNRKGTGLIHIYYGDGKGKTTTGMGLSIRAAGYGYRVLIYQFMKNNKTSERKILERVDNITLVDGLEQEKFSFQMTPEEKKERLAFYNAQFQKVTEKAVREGYDVLFLDETIYTISAGLLDEKPVLDFLKNKPDKLEVILTGNTPSEAMLDAADYVSCIKKMKHPFDEGQQSRMGIEK
ncbi:MAG: cob(I)yrinic acid a,c-diamide adenosyltransferase [Hominisplanchenecus sp.]